MKTLLGRVRGALPGPAAKSLAIVSIALCCEACDILKGPMAVLSKVDFPAENCVADALSKSPGVTEVEIVERASEKVTPRPLFGPRDAYERREVVAFDYGGHSFFIQSFHNGATKERWAHSPGWNINQSPPPDFLRTYDVMIETVGPVVAGACWGRESFTVDEVWDCPRTADDESDAATS